MDLRQWTLRLVEEYEHICFSHRKKLRKPVIKISSLESRWAQWDPDLRTITFSTQLLSKCTWDVVVEVMKHEMAHQVVDEVYGADEGHGVLFQRACDELGVTDWARSAQVESLTSDLNQLMNSWRNQTSGSNEERLIQRVEKLLRLANSSNEFESVAAMKKVQELYLKYHLDREISAKRSDYVYLSLRLKKKRVERYQSMIATLLQDFFRVEVIHTEEFDSEAGEPLKVIELLGRKENILLAEYVFYFLSNQLTELWKQSARASASKGLKKRNSFYLGVLAGFREKLEANEKSILSGDASLAVVVRSKDSGLESFLHSRYPRLVKISHSRLMQDGLAYEAGKSAGRSLVLRQGISTNTQTSHRYLPKAK